MKFLVEKGHEDAVDGGKVGLLDECGPLVCLEVDICTTKAVVLLFELVNMSFKDVVARNGRKRKRRGLPATTYAIYSSHQSATALNLRAELVAVSTKSRLKMNWHT